MNFTFKKLRKMQNITLSQAANNICSVSMLSRWENGQGKMDFEKVVELLERINLTPAEFLALSGLNQPDDLSQDLEKAWLTKDQAKLQQLTTTALAKFQTSQKLIDLNYAAICASLYYNLSRKNLLSISNQNLLNKELSHLSVWGQENLSLFRTLINVLSPRIIYQVSYQVIEYLDFIQAAGHDTFYFAITTLFEAAIALFKANNFKYAQKILDKLNTLTFKERDMQLIIGRHFLNQLAEYHNQPNEQKIIKTISFLREIGANHLAHYFLTIFNQIK